MKKRNKKINNVLYSMVFELIFIPLLAYVSYYIYANISYFSFMDNILMNYLIVAILVVLNLVALYYIAYVLNHIYKFDLEYQIVTGLIIIFIFIWVKVYYSSVEQTVCSSNVNIGCFDATLNNNMSTAILIFLIVYNLVYIPMHIITKRSGKKIKLSLN